MNYGLPYKGSKNKIAKEIVDQLPAAKHFYDLFAGGCAVTHAAMLSGKYKTFTINDIHPQIVQLFVDAVNGKYRDEKRIISREDFDRLKNSDPYVAICWSFGNNGHGYLWNSETEKAKLLACKMILADSVRERWQAYLDFIKYLQSVRTELQRRRENKERLRAELGDIESGIREELRRYLEESGKTSADIDRILGTNGMAGHYFGKSQWEFPTEEKYEQIRAACPNFPPYDYWGERLQSLESLESLERLESLTGDYQSIAISPDSVVYCDPPYRGTSGYKRHLITTAFMTGSARCRSPSTSLNTLCRTILYRFGKLRRYVRWGRTTTPGQSSVYSCTESGRNSISQHANRTCFPSQERRARNGNNH